MKVKKIRAASTLELIGNFAFLIATIVSFVGFAWSMNDKLTPFVAIVYVVFATLTIGSMLGLKITHTYWKVTQEKEFIVKDRRPLIQIKLRSKNAA